MPFANRRALNLALRLLPIWLTRCLDIPCLLPTIVPLSQEKIYDWNMSFSLAFRELLNSSIISRTCKTLSFLARLASGVGMELAMTLSSGESLSSPTGMFNDFAYLPICDIAFSTSPRANPKCLAISRGCGSRPCLATNSRRYLGKLAYRVFATLDPTRIVPKLLRIFY